MEDKSSVRAYYDAYATKYDDFYLPIQKEKCSHLLPYFPVAPIYLDLGGGSGFLSDWINIPVINIDISSEMLHTGLDKSRKYNGVSADLEHLPIRNSCMDGIISFTAIQNCESPTKALMELRRVLTPMGICMITILRKSAKTDEIVSYLTEEFVSNEIMMPTEDRCFRIAHLP
ncbi:MAG: methyltransferase domain-containing protein [Candidatus Kariarchaeaceae archaeon]|jgi:ubiquinone/menaquinone biosynthesis C-methylase UbiE